MLAGGSIVSQGGPYATARADERDRPDASESGTDRRTPEGSGRVLLRAGTGVLPLAPDDAGTTRGMLARQACDRAAVLYERHVGGARADHAGRDPRAIVPIS